MPSNKITEFLEQAEHYRQLKEQAHHLPTRQILEQMETSYRILAHSQERLEQSKSTSKRSIDKTSKAIVSAATEAWLYRSKRGKYRRRTDVRIGKPVKNAYRRSTRVRTWC